MNLIDYLKARGLIDGVTSEDLSAICQKPLKVYVGFDPTADSLHLGNLIGIIVLAHFQRFGHTPVIVLGGATGRIGDPSGKNQERPLLDEETIEHNIRSIRRHFEQILNFTNEGVLPIILNNGSWFEQFKVIDFLRDVGKHFRIGTMLAKESVKARLSSEEGMSFTEFSYQLIQAYDFFHLYKEHGVTLQMGGSDQWGNITAGIELSRRLLGASVHGLTWPLLTRSDGKKFGKSEGGAIWLDPERTSPYHFYQYFFRISDADVIGMMKRLTFMELQEIEEIEREMSSKNYVANRAQKRLAEEMTRIVHGKEGLEKALKVTEAAAPGKGAKLDPKLFGQIIQDMPSKQLPKAEVVNKTYVEVALSSGLVLSKGEGGRLIKNGGAYLNNERVVDPLLRIEEKDLIEGEYLLLNSGKKNKILVRVVDSNLSLPTD